jgi:maleate isomerase
MQTSRTGADPGQARIGIAVPSVNTVMEPWAQRVVPETVSVHFARMFLPDETNAETLIQMDRNEGMHAIRQLASARPHVVAYGCTASSMVQGLAYDKHLRQEIEHAHNVPVTTAALAILTALAAFGARRISAVSPYTDEVDAAEHRYFEAAGLEVLGGANLNISDGFRLASPEPDELMQLGLVGWASGSDALVISCLNTRSHTVIEVLEQKLGKPVITSTQATLWHALRLAGVHDAVSGCGRLFREH